MHKAFFLDRDGTINIDHNFVHAPEEWDWCTGAVSACIYNFIQISFLYVYFSNDGLIQYSKEPGSCYNLPFGGYKGLL